MGQFIDLHGQRFGRWTVLSLGERIIPRGHRYWLCRCDCGTEREVKGGSLRNGSSASCRKCSHLGELYHKPGIQGLEWNEAALRQSKRA